MAPQEAARQLDQLARDLDLVVFALERPPRTGPDEPQGAWTVERAKLRRDLDALRLRLEDLARAFG